MEARTHYLTHENGVCSLPRWTPSGMFPSQTHLKGTEHGIKQDLVEKANMNLKYCVP